MPTGYTAGVEDGTVTDFATFALQCARAFGATIMQRDDPFSEPPKHRVPSDFYEKSLAGAQAEAKRLATLTLEEAEREAEAAYQKRLAENREYAARREVENGRYRAMLASVHAWEPPTADHHSLKEFMIQQLTVSMNDYEPSPPVKKSGRQWLKEQQERAHENVGRYAEEHAKEIARCAAANAWIDALYASLSREPAVTSHA